MGEIVAVVSELDGVLVVVAEEESGSPHPASGDAFFFYAPDGVLPERTQPFATTTTKDTPGDRLSQLDRPGRFRVNVHVGRDRAAEVALPGRDAAEMDVVVSHPLYGAAGWVCVVNPAERTSALVGTFLREAYERARVRASRRTRGV